jgi:hypothetical protein
MATSTTASAAVGTTSTTSATGVVNLPATAQVKADLKGAFIARKQIAVEDVAGTTPGSVYYAYDNSTKTY